MPHFTMDQLRCCISSLVLLLSLTVSTCRATTIYGFEGQDVTLPCKYDSGYHGVCDVCWMRGRIPSNGCGAQIIYAYQNRVLMRYNGRYQLNGQLLYGDASLTILNARRSDSGLYGCRVHVPGWFNDKKIVVTLAIREAPVRTTHVPTILPEHVTTKPTETPQINSTTLGYVTTTPLIRTQGPVLTTQNYKTTTSEYATTNNTGLDSTMQYETTDIPVSVTTNHTGLDSTMQYETTDIPVSVTTNHTGLDSTMQYETTDISVNVTTNHTENYPDKSSMDNNTPVKEFTVPPEILVPVIVILGIACLIVIAKHKRRFRTTLKIAKKDSSSFVSYNNLDNSVTMPMKNSSY